MAVDSLHNLVPNYHISLHRNHGYNLFQLAVLQLHFKGQLLFKRSATEHYRTAYRTAYCITLLAVLYCLLYSRDTL